jgi:hypothetical protein
MKKNYLAYINFSNDIGLPILAALRLVIKKHRNYSELLAAAGGSPRQ